MVMEDDLTLGGEHTMQYTDHVSYKCTLETCIILLTNVFLISSIWNKTKRNTLSTDASQKNLNVTNHQENANLKHDCTQRPEDCDYLININA